MSEFSSKYVQIENWFKDYRKGHQVMGIAISAFDEFTKYKTLVDQIPDSENALKIEIEDKLLGPISVFCEALGPSLSINAEDITFTGATVSSSSSYMIEAVQNYTPADSEWLKGYRNNTFTLVNRLQETRKSIEFIAKNLTYMHEPLGAEFSELVDLQEKFTGNIDYPSSLGIKMRNVLEHFRGVCNKCAVIKKNGSFKKSDDLTWNQISEFIALNGRGSKYDNEFKKIVPLYTNLHSILSKEAKDYSATDMESLKDSYLLTIQYLESSLKLIDIENIKTSL